MGESVKDDRISGLTKGWQSCDKWRTRENEKNYGKWGCFLSQSIEWIFSRLMK